MDRLLIVRLGSLGDVIHTVPAAYVLRQAFPEAKMGWAIEERWSELLSAKGVASVQPEPFVTEVAETSQGRPLVDTLHFISTVAWRRALLSDATWRQIITEMLGLRRQNYPVVVDFQGLWKSAVLAAWSGAPTRYGFDHPREWPAGMFYTHRVQATAKHIVEQNLELALAVAPQARRQIGFPLARDPAAEQWCEAELGRRDISRFALISPGAGWGAKLWPEEKFGEVARELVADGVPVLINFGPGQDALVRAVEQASQGAAQGMRCSLAELIALTRRASIFIGGDTGPTHLAAALSVPVVALFGPTNPERNRPYGSRVVVLRSQASVTTQSHLPRRDPGLASISVAEVIAAARRLLEIAQ